MIKISVTLLAVGLAAACPHAALGYVVLFDNGPINAADGAWGINQEYVSDSFTLSNAATVDAIEFGSYTVPGETVNQTDFVISSGPAGTGTRYAGEPMPIVSSTFVASDRGFNDIDENIFDTGPVDLGAGSYYLTLLDATSTGDATGVSWAVSDGPSTAYDDGVYEGGQSESFQVLGSTPEPSGIILVCMGALFVGFLALRRRTAALKKS